MLCKQMRFWAIFLRFKRLSFSLCIVIKKQKNKRQDNQYSWLLCLMQYYIYLCLHLLWISRIMVIQSHYMIPEPPYTRRAVTILTFLVFGEMVATIKLNNRLNLGQIYISEV